MLFYKISKPYYQKCEKEPTINNILSFFSAYVWEKLKFAFDEPTEISKTDETYLTSFFIELIARAIKTEDVALPIRLFYSKNEAANGSDLEIVIRVRQNKNLIFACQAKKLYVHTATVKKSQNEARYDALNHDNKNGEQIDLLLKFAKSNNILPIYLLYNYVHGNISLPSIYPKKELYGATLISAQELKSRGTLSKLSFNDLHPTALPLVSLATIHESSVKDLWGGFDAIKFHTDSALKDSYKAYGNAQWIELDPSVENDDKRFLPPPNFNLEQMFVNSPKKSYNTSIFNPKFRIMIIDEPIHYRTPNFSI